MTADPINWNRDASPTLWEYKTVKLKLRGVLGGKFGEDEINEMLNQNGAEGWELVSTLTTALYQGRTQNAALIFKRPRR